MEKLEKLCDKLSSRREYHSNKNQHKVACAYAVAVCEIKLYMKAKNKDIGNILKLIDTNEVKPNE
jgi:hypothetical protein